MRNEKIILVVLAYVIGFTTAFIAYDLIDNTVTVSTDLIEIATPTATIQSYSEANQSANILMAIENEAGLFASYKGINRIVSAKNSFSEKETHGFHYAIANAIVSPNNSFIYFCEQKTEDSMLCDAYVYDLDTDSVHTVAVDGHQIQTFTSSDAAWLSDNTLQVDVYYSEDTSAPWRVVQP